MTAITKIEVRAALESAVADIIADFHNEHDTDRETIIERMDEEADTMFGQLVQHGLITEYDIDDLVRTAGPCAEIIRLADMENCVEDDSGLWEGLTYGVLASVAFFSLRNLLYNALKNAGHDSNDEYPFAKPT